MTAVLKPESDTVTRVRAGIQRRDGERTFGVRHRVERHAGVVVLDDDGGAGNDAAGRIGDRAGERGLRASALPFDFAQGTPSVGRGVGVRVCGPTANRPARLAIEISLRLFMDRSTPTPLTRLCALDDRALADCCERRSRSAARQLREKEHVARKRTLVARAIAHLCDERRAAGDEAPDQRDDAE